MKTLKILFFIHCAAFAVFDFTREGRSSWAHGGFLVGVAYMGFLWYVLCPWLEARKRKKWENVEEKVVADFVEELLRHDASKSK